MNADVAQMNVLQERVISAPFYSASSGVRSSAFSKLFAYLALAASSLAAIAEVTVSDAWVRGTVPAQKSTGAFMTLHSTDHARIVEVRTPVAQIAEIHASEMQGGVMQMHAMEDFLLLPGKRVELKPGGYHIMLMGLARPLAAGDSVPLTIVIEEAKGKRQTLEVKAEVRPLAK
jgi:copper(I)-binding protein